MDERTRMDEHPGIVFRDGPTGRRAALTGGPDVWELVAAFRSGSQGGEASIPELAEILELSVGQVQIALGYYAAYPEEVDARVARLSEPA